MSSYSFPTIEISELVEIMNELMELGIKEEDFRSPTKERWMRLYIQIAGQLTGMQAELFNQTHLQPTTPPFTYTLHDDAIPAVNVAIVMKRIASSCGLENFHIGDVFEPKTKRLEHLCSGIVNFRRFQAERLATFESMKLEKDVKLDRQNTLRRENEEMKQKIESIKACKVEQESQLAELRKSAEEKRASLMESHKTATESRLKLKDAKEKNAEKKNRIASLHVSLESTRGKCTTLEARIVQSPDRKRCEQDALVQQLAERRTQLATREADLLGAQQTAALQAQRLAECEAADELVDVCARQVAMQRELSAEISQIKEQMASSAERMEEQRLEVQRLHRTVQARKEKYAKMVAQHDARMADERAHLQRVQDEMSLLEQQCSSEQKETQALHRAMQQLREQDADAAQAHSARMHDMRSKYMQLLQHVDDFNSTHMEGAVNRTQQLLM